jgi:hypothetical protein
VLAGQLLARALQELAHRGVHVDEDQVLAEQRDAVERLLEDGLEALLAAAHGLLGQADAQEGVDAGHQHRRLDRVGQVAVGAALEALHLAAVGHEGGRQVDDRHARHARHCAHPPHDLEAVDVGQVHVEHDHVGHVLAGGLHGLLAQRRQQHLEACVPQDAVRGVERGRVGVDHQDRLDGGGPPAGAVLWMHGPRQDTPPALSACKGHHRPVTRASRLARDGRS